MNPVLDFFKYARQINVKEHIRHVKGRPDEQVDAYVRGVADGSAHTAQKDKDEPKKAKPAPKKLPEAAAPLTEQEKLEAAAAQDPAGVIAAPEPPPGTVEYSGPDDIALQLAELDETEFLLRDNNQNTVPGVTPDQIFKVQDVKSPDQIKADRKASELEMWQKWRQTKNPADLSPLMKSFKPLVNMKMAAYRGRVKLIPDAAMEAEFNIQLVHAFNSFDPSKGTLGTYVYSYLDKSKRFITENQNVGRIPENRVYKIKEYLKAKDHLSDDLGRIPTDDEMSKRLGWAKAEVVRMDSELRNDLLSSGFESDPYAIVPSKSEETMKLFKYELTGREREVYEHLTGYGKSHLSTTGDISRKMGIPDYQVSRYKESIQKKLARYVRDE